MPETRTQAPGTFCWCEISTLDVPAAREFYGELFGWTFREGPSDAGSYTMLRHGDADIGGMYELPPQMREQGIPPHWMSYVLVESADATAAKAKELGGNVAVEPLDVMDSGRLAVLQDPAGAPLSVWEARRHVGAGVAGAPGTPCWHECISRDKAESGAFWAALFGWKIEDFPGSAGYSLFKLGDASVGGLMGCTPEMGPVPSHWMIYFAVEDADATAAEAERLGGKIVHPPSDVPGVGRWVLLADPSGAMFTVMRFESPSA